ncbi:HAD-like domain-containing protein [Bisporella sp. PMI_857]|nr:HAD-like domain-containing protein [Bisporella sp. PMI_857]
MATEPDFIFFTDFDGTITLQDSNDYLIDNIGIGQIARKKANQDVLNGKSTRDLFEWMMDSVKTPYDECLKLLCENIKLDPYFAQFYAWARENNIPVVILSGGVRPGIKALLVHFLGEEYANEIQIVSNDIEQRYADKGLYSPGGWKVKFHDKSDFGHDKSIEIRKYSNLPGRPTLFYAGDGVSDLSAAKETDLLFAKEGGDLITYCVKEGVPFTQFSDWAMIHDTVKDIVHNKTTVEKVVVEGLTNFVKQKKIVEAVEC